MSLWHRLAEHLSLDSYGPLFQMMGLLVDEGKALMLRQRCRDLVIASIREGEDRLLLEALAFDFGPAWAAQFRIWAEDTYDSPFTSLSPDTARQWYAYLSFFSKTLPWKFRSHWHERLASIGLDAVAGIAIEAYLRWKDESDFEATIVRIRQRPLSDWDARIYHLRHYTNDVSLIESYDGNWFDPFLVAELTTANYRFQCFWESLVPRLSGEQLQYLYDAAQQHYMAPKHTLLRPPWKLRRRLEWPCQR
jgi:hypothetical protein